MNEGEFWRLPYYLTVVIVDSLVYSFLRVHGVGEVTAWSIIVLGIAWQLFYIEVPLRKSLVRRAIRKQIMNDDAQIQRYHVFIYRDMYPEGGMNDYKGQVIVHKSIEDTPEKLTDYLCQSINSRRWSCNNGFGHIYTIDCSEELIKRATFKCIGVFANGTVTYHVEDLQWET